MGRDRDPLLLSTTRNVPVLRSIWSLVRCKTSLARSPVLSASRAISCRSPVQDASKWRISWRVRYRSLRLAFSRGTPLQGLVLVSPTRWAKEKRLLKWASSALMVLPDLPYSLRWTTKACTSADVICAMGVSPKYATSTFVLDWLRRKDRGRL